MTTPRPRTPVAAPQPVPVRAADARAALARAIDDSGHSCAALSRLLGRNHAYLQQYLRRGTPRFLAPADRRRLSDLLPISYEALSPAAPSNASPVAGLTPFTVEGDAMAPLMRPGDIAWVALEDRRPRVDALFALGQTNAPFFRRYGHLPGGTPAWLAEAAPPIADAAIVGHVEWIMRRA
ncbi:MAG: hypothetical protein ACFB22_05570 [Rhodothalassiaceae bacterium]